MCEYLMQFGCVINASDKKDRRALHFAACENASSQRRRCGC